jgi:hypothetical protein
MSKLDQAVKRVELCLSDERKTTNDSPGFLYKREETDRAIEELKLVSGFYRSNN